MKKILYALIFVTLFSACEKDINFDLKDASPLLVVDAKIENNEAPVVVLTKSLDFYSSIDPALLFKSFVRNADVRISNGTLTHKLKEYGQQLAGTDSIYYYSIDSGNLATAFLGQLNTRYTLNIKVDGEDYTASTTIPTLAKRLDSIWWRPAPFSDDTTKVILMVKVTDPPGLGNYIRYFTSKNNNPFLPGENSVFDDQVIDNTTYELKVDPGVNRNNPGPFNDNYFKRGDNITLKIANIDKPTYTFWSTWEFAFQSIGNPFAQPNKVVGNISNAALGAFYGYGSSSKTIAIPK